MRQFVPVAASSADHAKTSNAAVLERIAKLSDLRLPEDGEERRLLLRQVDSMVHWTQQIQSEEGLDELKPLLSPLEIVGGADYRIRLREDEVTVDETIRPPVVLRNAPHQDREHFVVPKVVDLDDS
eukprot:TRINITY_DN72945_c0_g1_i1.p2 TRINITY_DN72945_c0_g1~~TRINITY_DN72945_c0_g1_i1.p2  ORF type:complete len:126 (-),score=52.91 TRINITY_DN72945_c0_g1_i1:42-419(-)